MVNKEVIGFKIAEYLMSKGYTPAPEQEYNAKGMLLVNESAPKYGTVFLSMDNNQPSYYEELIKKLNEGMKQNVAILAFDETTLKFEGTGGDLYVCGKSLHNDLKTVFPELNEIIYSEQPPSIEVTQVLVKDIKEKVIKEIFEETNRATSVVTSRSDRTLWILGGMFAFVAVVPYLLIANLIPDVWETANATARLLFSGASYAALTFENNQWWRLLTGFLVNDILWIAIVLLSLRQVIPTVESIYGKFRTVLIFMLTGIIITYAKTIIHPHEISYGAQEVIFCMFGMLLYYGYYDRLLLKMYLPRSIQSFVVLGLLSIFFNPYGLIYILLSMGLGYLLASIFGFKNSKTTKEVLLPISALLMFVGGLVFLQLRLNWRYSDVSYITDIMDQLWAKLFKGA